MARIVNTDVRVPLEKVQVGVGKMKSNMPYFQIFPENTKTVQKFTIIIEILRKHQRKVGKSKTELNSFENKQKWVSVR